MAEIKDFSRLCKAHKVCISEGVICPMYSEDGACKELLVEAPEEADRIITEWCREHPQKTYIQDFMEKFPNAPLRNDGTPNTCPDRLYKTAERYCKKGSHPFPCKDCWNEVMPDA